MKIIMTLVLAMAMFMAMVPQKAIAVEKEWCLKTDGDAIVSLRDVDYLFCPDGSTSFTVMKKGGDALNGLHSFIFVERDATANELVKSATIALFPNPVETSFTLSGITKGDVFRIVSITGSEILAIPVTEETTQVDVSQLSSGIYLLVTKNSTLKFIKK